MCLTSAKTGAAASLVNANSYEKQKLNPDPGHSILIVEDTRLALGQLAAILAKADRYSAVGDHRQ